MIETFGQTAERERAMAKALSMSVLFRADHYKNIVSILNQGMGTEAKTKISR